MPKGAKKQEPPSDLTSVSKRFRKIDIALPPLRMLGKGDGVAFAKDPDFMAATEKFLESKFAVLNFIIPPPLVAANEEFFYAALRPLLEELAGRENGFHAYVPSDKLDCLFLYREGVYGVLSHRMTASRPEGYCPSDKNVEARLIGGILHDLLAAHEIFNSRSSVPVRPSNDHGMMTMVMLIRPKR